MDEASARKLICEIGKLLYDRSYVVSSDGNVSVRLEENRILGDADDDLQRADDGRASRVTDMDGNPLSDKKASSRIGDAPFDIQDAAGHQAVCHAHPPHGTAFAVAGLAIDKPIFSRSDPDSGLRSFDRITERLRQTS